MTAETFHRLAGFNGNQGMKFSLRRLFIAIGVFALPLAIFAFALEYAARQERHAEAINARCVWQGWTVDRLIFEGERKKLSAEDLQPFPRLRSLSFRNTFVSAEEIEIAISSGIRSLTFRDAAVAASLEELLALPIDELGINEASLVSGLATNRDSKLDSNVAILRLRGSLPIESIFERFTFGKLEELTLNQVPRAGIALNSLDYSGELRFLDLVETGVTVSQLRKILDENRETLKTLFVDEYFEELEEFNRLRMERRDLFPRRDY